MKDDHIAKRVPREPANHMLDQGLVYVPGVDRDALKAAWRVMYDMSPPTPIIQLDSKRAMEILAAVMKARFALEYWDREARWGSGDHDGSVPVWASGAAPRGAHECATLQEVEDFLRELVR